MFHGSIVALVTPMDERGRIDPDALRKLVDYQLANHTNALVIAGTTGEGAALVSAEFEDLVSAVISQVDGRLPVIAGTGSASTAKSIEMTKLASRLGADAALVVTPYYVRPMQSGLEAHFSAIADASGIPLVLYNVPGRTSVDMLPETVALLARRDEIVAIKEAVADVDRIGELVDRCGDRLAVLSGDDSSCMESMLRGARGVVSVAANVDPGRMHRLWQAADRHDVEACRAINDELRDLYRLLSIQSNPIPVKWAVSQMGLIGAGIRLPLLPFEEEHRADAENCLRKLGLLAT